MRINLIVAADSDNCIGNDGDLPWYLPSDLAWFKQVTAGHTCIAGSVTQASIEQRLGKPLPNRTTIVLTRKHKPDYEGVIHATYVEQAISQAMFAEKRRNPDGANPPWEIFVIGGAQIYELLLPYTERVLLTRVMTSVRGETYLPPEWLRGFELTIMNAPHQGEHDEYPFVIEIHERRA